MSSDSFWGDGNVLEIDRGAGLHSAVNVLNATELFTLKWVNFLLCEFHLYLKQINWCSA